VDRKKALRAAVRRIELAQAAQNVAFAAAVARLRPDSAAGSRDVAGGHAVRVPGAMTEALALGLSGPVSAEELDKVEAFLGEGGARFQIELSPFADETLAHLLAERRYRIDEQILVLGRRLDGTLPAMKLGSLSARAVQEGEEAAFSRVVMQGFSGEAIPIADEERLIPATATEGTTAFLVVQDGEPVGGGTLGVSDKIGSLAGSAVRKSFRGKGAHGALIAARLATAVARGCEIAVAAVLPASASQRNLERTGFRVLYPKAILVPYGT
jgi:GNAT superfamily N-acetyltransferase